MAVTDTQIFVVSDNVATEVFKAEAGMLPIEGATEINELISGEIELSVQNSLSTRTRAISNNEVSPAEIMSTVKEARTATFDTGAAESVPMRPETFAYREVIGDVPKYTQPSKSNYCWAVSAWCVGESVNRRYLNPEYCVDYAGGSFGSGGSVVQQKKILTQIYGRSNPTLYYTLSQASIKKLINRNEPFIMLCYVNGQSDGSQLGHSVTGYAYDDSSKPYKVAVMDSLPLSDNYRWMATSGSNY